MELKSNFSDGVLYLMRTKNRENQIITFLLKKEKLFESTIGEHIEFHITYKYGDNQLCNFSVVFYCVLEKIRFVSFEVPHEPLNIHYRPSTYFMLPGGIQGCKLGSLLMFELHVFKNLYYPNANFRSFTVAADYPSDNTIRRDKLYNNFGFFNGVYKGLKAELTQSNYGFEISVLNEYPRIDPTELLTGISYMVSNKLWDYKHN